MAAHWWGYKWEEWEALDGEEQSFRYAVYAANSTIEAIQSEEAYRKSQGWSGIGFSHGLTEASIARNDALSASLGMGE